jgi:hypothetical protein
MAARPVETGYSAAVSKVAELFVATSKNGDFADPQLRVDAIVEQTGLTEDGLEDALTSFATS